jgi:hypothetical protein
MAKIKKKIEAVWDDPDEVLKRDHIFTLLNNQDELRDWIFTYFDVDLTAITTDEDSTSNPCHAMWTIYEALKENRGDKIPGYIMLSARSGYKTLTASMLEVLIILHFKTTVSHMAAIKSQSKKAISYVNKCLNQVKKYLDYHGWINTSSNESMISFRTPDGREPYIIVIIASISGANSAHTTVMCVGEGSLITVKNTGIKNNSRHRIKIAASTVFDLVKSGKDVEVLTLNHSTGSIEFKKVTNAFESYKALLKITTEHGNVLRCSAEHRLFVHGKGYVEAGSVTVGDSLLRLGKSSTYNSQINHALPESNEPIITPDERLVNVDKIVSIENTKQWRSIDLSVMDNNNFFAENILVHNCIDELDVIQNPAAYQEALLIPMYDPECGLHPITVKLSTRKYLHGLMEQSLQEAPKTGEKILRWNILDIAERCPPSLHSPNKKKTKVARYIARQLPFRQISEEEYANTIPNSQQSDWEKIEAYEGCITCPLLPACKTNLAKKPATAVGGLYKPISAVINDFKKVSPDVAEAQLLCWRPSSKGSIYGRFEADLKKDITRRNIISPEEAYEALMGIPMPKRKAMTEFEVIEVLREIVNQLGLPAYAGLDWGYRHLYAIIVGVVIPNGDFWIVETFGESGLELSDQLVKAQELKERWNIKSWFVDQAYPGSIKTFESNSLKCPKFVKDVLGGIEATRTQIVDASNKRRLKVVQWEKNELIKSMFRLHHFKLDPTGRVTEEPDDEELSDIGDATRYLFQNLFSKKKGRKPIITTTAMPAEDPNKMVNDAHALHEEIKRRSQAVSDPYQPQASKKNKKIFWSF